MGQGGLDWEMIAMVAAAASVLIIVWDLIATRRGSVRTDTRKGILEVAWPVLLIAAVITGLVWLFDAKVLRRRRTAGEPEPVVVDMARAFFPVIVVVFVI